jgi:hypothetical protein
MDSLSDLPPIKDTEQSQQEKNVMAKYFDVPQDGSNPGSNTPSMSVGWVRAIKVGGIASLLFILFANPFIDRLLLSVPYVNKSAITLLGAKFVLFFILFTLVYKYVV